VFVAPGTTDPPSEWRIIRNLPDNVVTFLETNDDPVALIRGGKVIASIASLDVGSLQTSARKGDLNASQGDARGPLTIGLLVPFVDGLKSATVPGPAELAPLLAGCALDYLALGGPGERQTITMKTGLAHHPGNTQAITAPETGPRGGTLIEVDQAGALKSSFLPTAVVRRERFEISIDNLTSQEQLISLFRESLSQRAAERGELIWLIDWTLRGSGALLETFETDADIARFFANAGLEGPSNIRLIHSCKVVREAVPSEQSTTGGTMFADFEAAVDGIGGTSRESLAGSFAASAPQNPEWSRALEPLIEQVDTESVAAHVRRLGAKWFSPAAAEGFVR